ncbi:hypothetical protein [Variovorax saccharolyticus]|uniref:hypothetical protein n=1 Tax=Variovorax saccharolyticus TaxID=3053516 RepID=UPI0025782C87|nr:hypothetical protein [Variovorax sp. J31P216]MDM0030069.1 hypothetical protein [Variovorax sp. J31P216]
MIGWGIVVVAQTPEERRQAVDRKAAVLATWEVGPGGIEWLRELVDAGNATQLSFDGYPNRYTALAGNVLPLLAAGPPVYGGPPVLGEDYVLPPNWRDDVILHQDRMLACSPRQFLTIEAWDLS